MKDFADGILSFIQEMWTDGDLFSQFVAIMSVVVIVIFIAAIAMIIVAVADWIIDRVNWYRNRKRCSHCNKWTLGVSDGEFPECPEGTMCCERCTHNHLMDNEEKLRCPVGDEVMTKQSINGELIIDTCPRGHGVWLTQDELDAIKQRSYNNGHSDGQSTGLATGVALGIAT